MRYISFLACCVLLVSCWTKKPPVEYDMKRWAWKPVYGAGVDYKKITWHNTSRSVEAAGKIYVRGNIIYQNDIGKGIHVIDNSNPSQARRVAFIEVAGSTEIAIKGNSLFTNNFMDIVEIDISNPGAAVEKTRVKDAFFTGDSQYHYIWQAPPGEGYYLCPERYLDSVVIDWVKDSVFANCYNY